MTVRAPVQAHAPLCDTLSALLLRARGDGETAPRAVLAMEHMEPMEQACSLVITPTLAMEHMEPMEPLEQACSLVITPSTWSPWRHSSGRKERQRGC